MLQHSIAIQVNQPCETVVVVGYYPTLEAKRVPSHARETSFRLYIRLSASRLIAYTTLII